MAQAATNVDFSALLAQKVDDTVMPEPLPPGTYQAVIRKYEPGVSSQKKTPYIGFTFGGFQPGPDVDTEAWAKYTSVEGRLSKATLEEDFYLTEQAQFRLKKFLEDVLGIQTTGRSYADCLAETPNMAVTLSVGQRMGQDGTSVYAEIKDISKAA